MSVVDLDRRASVHLEALIGAVRPDQFGAPTPCQRWSVRDLVIHVIAGNIKYAEIARGSGWARGVPSIDPGDDLAEMYARTVAPMLDAWERPGVLDREITLPVGRGRAEAALYLHLGETLVHGLAAATGQTPAFDDDVVEASLGQYRSWLPPERRPGTPFRNANLLGEDAPPLDRLAGYLGRDVGAWSR